jgi:hypothetical protein
VKTQQDEEVGFIMKKTKRQTNTHNFISLPRTYLAVYMLPEEQVRVLMTTATSHGSLTRYSLLH